MFLAVRPTHEDETNVMDLGIRFITYLLGDKMMTSHCTLEVSKRACVGVIQKISRQQDAFVSSE